MESNYNYTSMMGSQRTLMGSQDSKSLEMSDNSFSSSTSKPGEAESDMFGDGSCGEPLVAQHIVIDFTPVEEDTEYIQRKCCAFWDFINSQPGLQNMMAQPESNMYRNLETSNTSSEVEMPKIAEPMARERTAVSMLEIVEGKGLIDRTFETKIPQSFCTLGSREYHENTLPNASSHKTESVCLCSGTCNTCHKKLSDISLAPGPSSPAVVNLCRKMEQWDDVHPKSMEPPGHPPVLSRCIMQRKRIL